MFLTGQLIPAEDAFRVRLVNKVFESVDALREGALELANTLANKPGVAVGLATQSLDSSWQMSLDESLNHEIDAFCQTFDTQDVREGVSAFLEKRKPDFKHQ
ncbi:MAG: enoyl-CoA hydratase/isomerase family protein, partial [Candidatus Thorarchaeota archaeon]|jgi:enoyl-CoA hydratase